VTSGIFTCVHHCFKRSLHDFAGAGVGTVGYRAVHAEEREVEVTQTGRFPGVGIHPACPCREIFQLVVRGLKE